MPRHIRQNRPEVRRPTECNPSCSSAHLVQCEPDEASSFTNPNVVPGTYAGLWLELDTKVLCYSKVSESVRGPLYLSKLS